MADCQTCEKGKREIEPVPYITYESAMARNERAIRRIIVALIVVVLLWFSTIGIFVSYLSEYDFEAYEVELTTDGGGNANYIGQDGDIYNGESNSTEKE